MFVSAAAVVDNMLTKSLGDDFAKLLLVFKGFSGLLQMKFALIMIAVFGGE